MAKLPQAPDGRHKVDCFFERKTYEALLRVAHRERRFRSAQVIKIVEEKLIALGELEEASASSTPTQVTS